RHAAQRITILNKLAGPVPPIPSRFTAYQLRSGKQVEHLLRGPDLPRVRFDRMDEGIEALIRCQDSLEDQRINAKAHRQEISCTVHGISGNGSACASPVI